MATRPTDVAERPAIPGRERRSPRPAWLWESKPRAAAIVAAVAVLVFASSLLNGLAYDDVAIIQDDPRIRGFHLLEMLRLPYWRSNPDLAIYRPLTTLSFAVDWLVSRGGPWFFHAVNVLMHGAASALAYTFLAEFFAPAAAFMAALVFALHPVHVEAVANVVGRAEVLSAVFYLAALVVWARAERARARHVALVTVLYLLALLAKESSATLPGMLVLVDLALGRWTFRLGALRAYIRRALPVLVASTVVLAAFLVLRFQVLGRLAPSVVDPIFDQPMTGGQRVLTAFQAWPIFARLLFFPRTLLADYSPRIVMPAMQWTASAAAGAVILSVVLLIGLGALARGRGRLALGVLWFPLTMLPVSNLLFPIGIIVAERTLYLPVLAVGFAAAAVMEWSARRTGRTRRVVAAGAVAALALLALRTVTRIPVWDSTDKVFYALAADRPDSFRAAWHLARIARRQARTELALQRYQEAIHLWPYREFLVSETIEQMMRAHRPGQARQLAGFAVSRWPRSVQAQRHLATSALASADTATARTAASAGLRLDPADTTLLRVWRGVGGGSVR